MAATGGSNTIGRVGFTIDETSIFLQSEVFETILGTGHEKTPRFKGLSVVTWLFDGPNGGKWRFCCNQHQPVDDQFLQKENRYHLIEDLISFSSTISKIQNFLVGGWLRMNYSASTEANVKKKNWFYKDKLWAGAGCCLKNILRISASDIHKTFSYILVSIGGAVDIFHSYKPTGSINTLCWIKGPATLCNSPAACLAMAEN